MSKIYFQSSLSKFQVQLKEIFEAVLFKTLPNLTPRNCSAKNVVKNKLIRNGKKHDNNYLKILTNQNEHDHQNEASRNNGRYTYSSMWMFSVALPFEKQINISSLRNFFAFLNPYEQSYIKKSFLPKSFPKSMSEIINVKGSYVFKACRGYPFQTHWLQPNSKSNINDVLKRYCSSCDKDSGPKTFECGKKSKYPGLCKYCKRGGPPYKRKKPKSFFQWVCSLIGCKPKKTISKIKCCKYICKEDTSKVAKMEPEKKEKTPDSKEKFKKIVKHKKNETKKLQDKVCDKKKSAGAKEKRGKKSFYELKCKNKNKEEEDDCPKKPTETCKPKKLASICGGCKNISGKKSKCEVPCVQKKLPPCVDQFPSKCDEKKPKKKGLCKPCKGTKAKSNTC